MFTGVEDGTTSKDPQPNFNRCHCLAPNTNSGKLSLVGSSLAFSAGPFPSTPALSLLWDPVPLSATWAQQHVCLNHLSLTHLLRTVSSDSLCPLLAPPLSSPFPLTPFQESLQPLVASSVQFPQCLSAFRKSRRKQMYPWEVTASLGDLSL